MLFPVIQFANSIGALWSGYCGRPFMHFKRARKQPHHHELARADANATDSQSQFRPPDRTVMRRPVPTQARRIGPEFGISYGLIY